MQKQFVQETKNKILSDFLIEYIAVSAGHRVKIKERQKIEKCQDVAKELKKLWSMKMTVIPIVFGVLGTDLKDLEKWLINRIETIQSTTRIFKRVW